MIHQPIKRTTTNRNLCDKQERVSIAATSYLRKTFLTNRETHPNKIFYSDSLNGLCPVHFCLFALKFDFETFRSKRIAFFDYLKSYFESYFVLMELSKKKTNSSKFSNQFNLKAEQNKESFSHWITRSKYLWFVKLFSLFFSRWINAELHYSWIDRYMYSRNIACLPLPTSS